MNFPVEIWGEMLFLTYCWGIVLWRSGVKFTNSGRHWENTPAGKSTVFTVGYVIPYKSKGVIYIFWYFNSVMLCFYAHSWVFLYRYIHIWYIIVNDKVIFLKFFRMFEHIHFVKTYFHGKQHKVMIKPYFFFSKYTCGVTILLELIWLLHCDSQYIARNMHTVLLWCALLWLYIDWFSHIHQVYFTGTVRLPQCQQSNPDEYG